MSDTLLDMVGREIGKFLEPITNIVDDPILLDRLMASLGISTPDTKRDALLASLTEIATLTSQINTLLAQPSNSIDEVAAMLDVSRQALTALSAIESVIGSSPEFAGLGRELADRLLTNYLFIFHPLLRSVAALITIEELAEDIEPTAPVVQDSEIVRESFTVDRFHFDRLGNLLRDPVAALRAEYGNALATSGDADAMAGKLFPRLQRVLHQLGVSCRYGFDPDDRPLLGDAAPFLDHALIIYTDDILAGAPVEAGIVLTISAADRGDLGLVISPFGALTSTRQVGSWMLDMNLSADVDVVAYGRHGLTLLASADVAKVIGKLSATLASPDEGPAFIFGSPTGTRLEIGGAQLKAETSLSEAKQSLALSADVSSSVLVISSGDGDGFISSILPRDGLRTNFDLGLAWSNEKGLTLRGSAGLDATFPVGLSIAGVTLSLIHLRLQAADAGVLAEISAAVIASIGPVEAVIDGIGIATNLSFPETGGNIGVADLDIGFKPPNGIGLKVQASGVEGGGFLLYDPDNEQYAGVVQLQLLEFTLKAIGLLTPAPKGSTVPFSLILVFSIEDFEPIVFGPGIKWTAFGGLVGLNRTANVEAFRAGLKNHALDSVLFPENPVAEAPRLLASLRTLFPPAADRFLVGVAAKFEWPTPTLLTAELGFIVELPTPFRLIVIGQFRARLPRPDLAQVKINVDAVGIYDFQKNELSIDATLFESSILSYALTGDGILRMGGKETILSLGGFHPHYKPPPGLPQLQRLAVNFSEGSTLRLRAEAYVAITSNSLQFGAKIDAFIGFGGFSVEGGLGFDILFQSEYPEFVAIVHCGIAVKYDGETLAGAQLDMTVSGYKPLHLQGKATFELFGFDVSKSFNKTFFKDEPPATLPLVDPLPDLVAALRDGRNWSTKLPKEVSTLVTVRNRAASDVVLIHPLGEIAVRQRVVPLNLELTRFGQSRLAGDKHFAITDFTLGDQHLEPPPLREKFARGQFLDLTDTERLSQPSLDSLDAGVEVSSVDIRFGGQLPEEAGLTAVDDLAYETCIVGEDGACLPVKELHQPDGETVVNHAQVGPAARAALQFSGARKFQTTSPAVQVQASAYAIASVDDLQAVHGGTDQKTPTYASYTAAEQALQWQKSQQPGRRDDRQIVWKFELAKENS